MKFKIEFKIYIGMLEKLLINILNFLILASLFLAKNIAWFVLVSKPINQPRQKQETSRVHLQIWVRTRGAVLNA